MCWFVCYHYCRCCWCCCGNCIPFLRWLRHLTVACSCFDIVIMIWFIAVAISVHSNITSCCGVYYSFVPNNNNNNNDNQTILIQSLNGFDQCAKLDMSSFLLKEVINDVQNNSYDFMETIFGIDSVEVSRGSDGGCIVKNSPYNCLNDTIHSCVDLTNATYADSINMKIDTRCAEENTDTMDKRIIMAQVVGIAVGKIILLCLGISCKYLQHELNSPQDEIIHAEQDPRPHLEEPVLLEKIEPRAPTHSISNTGVLHTYNTGDHVEYDYQLMVGEGRSNTPGGDRRPPPPNRRGIRRFFSCGFLCFCAYFWAFWKFIFAFLWWALKHAYFTSTIIISSSLSLILALIQTTEVVGFLSCSEDPTYEATCLTVEEQCWLRQWVIMPGLNKVNLPKMITTIIAVLSFTLQFFEEMTKLKYYDLMKKKDWKDQVENHTLFPGLFEMRAIKGNSDLNKKKHYKANESGFWSRLTQTMNISKNKNEIKHEKQDSLSSASASELITPSHANDGSSRIFRLVTEEESMPSNSNYPEIREPFETRERPNTLLDNLVITADDDAYYAHKEIVTQNLMMPTASEESEERQSKSGGSF